MIIHSSVGLSNLYQSATEAFNWNPKSGDAGHVEDHAWLARLLRDVPVPTSESGFKVFGKSGGNWMSASFDEDFRSTSNYQPVSWEQVVAADKPGVVFAGAGTEADGVTDYTEDVFPEGFMVSVFYGGLKGILDVLGAATTRIGVLRTDLESLTSRIEALENAAE